MYATRHAPVRHDLFVALRTRTGYDMPALSRDAGLRLLAVLLTAGLWTADVCATLILAVLEERGPRRRPDSTGLRIAPVAPVALPEVEAAPDVVSAPEPPPEVIPCVPDEPVIVPAREEAVSPQTEEAQEAFRRAALAEDGMPISAGLLAEPSTVRITDHNTGAVLHTWSDDAFDVAALGHDKTFAEAVGKYGAPRRDTRRPGPRKPPAKPKGDPYAGTSVAELRRLASRQGVKGTRTMTRAALLAALAESEVA